MDEKKCAKCGKELCDECTCEDDATMCKDCCGKAEEKEADGCGCCANKETCDKAE